MDHQPPNLTVIPGGSTSQGQRKVGGVSSPDKPPGELSTQERRVWNYICEQLAAAGIDHTTFGLAAMVICKTYIAWVQAETRLAQASDENGGSYIIKTPNGYEQPHQAYYVARELRRELMQHLPECCLTIPSLVNARSKMGDAGVQDDLFSDLVGHANEERSAYSRR